ncbi:AraC family transcriptional regulator [Sabulibacter ruber]|uniref:AraC family transcriptional regulator n=1 Tax=Sabulibacter ruber TaxID=2811901 RepID=UPI001A96FA92|nr:helix-turn-helix transcriptional regulator [Sabulibacter ruber]
MAEQIKTYGFKEGLPTEFEVVSISALYEKQKEALISPHRTAFYHIIWFQEGAPTHLVDFNPVAVKPGTLLFLNKDTVQLFDPNVRYEAKAILFTDSFFCRTPTDVKFLRSSILFNDLLEVSRIQMEEASHMLQDLFLLMEKEAGNAHEANHAAILQNYLHSFLLLAERERRKQGFTTIKPGADLDYTILFKDSVDSRFRQIKQVSSYADELSITEKRLNQATSRVLGKSPKNVIDDRIMLEAKRLLAHTGDSVKEIGFGLGFNEPTNFIKFFRRHSGTTPMEFRGNLAPD